MNSQSSTLEVVREAARAGANDDRDWLLCRGVKSLLRCDEAEVISGIARYVVSQHGGLRLLSALIERTRQTLFPAVVALVGAIKSILAIHPIQPEDRSDGAVWIARLGNERRAIEPLVQSLPELGWTELKFGRRPDAMALSALALRHGASSRRILRLRSEERRVGKECRARWAQ